VSHGPNRYRAEKRAAEWAAARVAADPRAAARAQRIIAAWNARARRGLPAEFFPTFETVLTAGCWRLTYGCPACRQMTTIDIRDRADAHHPRAPISVMIPKLSCEWCCPNPPLAVLIELGSPDATAPTIRRDVAVEDPQPRKEPAPPIPTMVDLPSHGVTQMKVWCGRWPHSCSYQATLPVDQIDLTQTIVQFAAKLQCPDCGTVGGHAMPHWPNGGGGAGGAHNHGGATMSGCLAPDPAPPLRKRRSRKAR
jgi:hypothetical protein